MATNPLVVTAPLVIGKTSEGRDLYLYQGASVDGQSKEWRERHLRDELIGERKGGERDMPTDSGSGSSSSSDEKDPVKVFLERKADDVIADVGTLSEADRGDVIAAEEAGANRVTVLRALRGE